MKNTLIAIVLLACCTHAVYMLAPKSHVRIVAGLEDLAARLWTSTLNALIGKLNEFCGNCQVNGTHGVYNEAVDACVPISVHDWTAKYFKVIKEMTAAMWFVLVVMANGMLAVMYETYATINERLGSSMRTQKKNPTVKNAHSNAGFVFKPMIYVPGSLVSSSARSHSYSFPRK